MEEESMSLNIGSYSQFYAGSEKIKQYGSAARGKDTLVRYEFNTRDANGNKIMDKMSREETLQAMKEISSRYGDNVIVEFSGDGMAKLMESRKGYLNRELSEEEAAARAEKQAKFDSQVVQMEGTHKKVEGKIDNHGYDFQEVLEANDPELAKQFKDLMTRIANHKEGDPSNAAEFNKLIKKAMGVVNAARDKKTASVENEQNDAELKLSDKAKKLLEKFRKTYGDMEFFVLGKGGDPKSLLSGGTKEYSVIFSAEEWEKMASDEKYAKEKMQSIDTVLRMTKKICEQEGYVSAFGQKNQDLVFKSIGVSVDDDGIMKIFAELEKTAEKQGEKAVKKTTVEALSVEEFLEKIKKVDWSEIK